MSVLNESVATAINNALDMHEDPAVLTLFFSMHMGGQCVENHATFEGATAGHLRKGARFLRRWSQALEDMANQASSVPVEVDHEEVHNHAVSP